MLKNRIKISYLSFKVRILLGFGVIIGLMVGIVSFGLINFSKNQHDVEALESIFLPNALLAEKMAMHTLQIQQFFTNAAITHDESALEDAKNASKDFKQGMSLFRERLAGDQEKMTELDALEKGFDWYYKEGERMTEVYKNQGADAGNLAMQDLEQLAKNLRTQLNRIRNKSVNDASNKSHAITHSAKQSIIYMSSISGIVIFGGLAFALYLTRNLSKQLGIDPIYAKDFAQEIANGDFSRDIKLEPGDKSSLLYAMTVMQHAINEFVAAQEKMAQKHAEGWIWEQMDDSGFQGTYATMARQLNTLVRSHIDVNMQVVGVIERYAQGDFSTDMVRLPGDQAKITEAVDGVKRTLQDVIDVIKSLAEAGSQGDFSKRSDSGRYNYLFKDILIDFNNLISTCDQGFQDILRVAAAMAEGDLTQTISKQYPGTFGAVIAGMNDTGENLKHLISDIKTAADTINIAAQEISAGNSDLSHRTEQQAASLEQTAASMDQLTATVQANAQNARQANELAQGAAEIAAKGGNVMGQVVTMMASISESARKIVDTIAVIDSIAFQTNILALNAAVEAARAGDQGRGFAVVAGEVRKLAHQAAAAAGEIKGLIGDSVAKVEDGGKLVAQAGLTMEEIVGAITQVTGMIAGITVASAEQSAGIQQVNQAIGQMDETTQQNAALVEQAAAAAESLEEQTEHLSVYIARFKLDDMGWAADEDKLEPLKRVAASRFLASERRRTVASGRPALTVAAAKGWEEF